MMKIDTINGIYEYKELSFQNGSKYIDRKVSKDNLLEVRLILEKNEICFGLIYGTLLGAIRENNFIEHDEDTDIFILAEDKEKLLSTLFELRQAGFEVGRYDGKLLSIVRNGEYIDIYEFIKKSKSLRECDGYVIRSHYLEELKFFSFLGEMFRIPENAELLLVDLYGKDWMVPKVNEPASNYGLYLTIKMFIKRNLKPLFLLISLLKRTLKL